VDDLEATKFWSVDEDKAPDKSAKRRIREKNHRKLKRGLYDDAFDGSVNVAEKFVNQILNQHRGEGLLRKTFCWTVPSIGLCSGMSHGPTMSGL